MPDAVAILEEVAMAILDHKAGPHEVGQLYLLRRAMLTPAEREADDARFVDMMAGHLIY